MDLKGKVALVTGASRGIGEAIAYELAASGANVVVMAKSTKDSPHRRFGGTIDETVERIESYGVQGLAVQGDVSHEDDVERVRDQTIERFGKLDVLVNNAALSYVSPFLELSVKRWDLIFAVNVRGPMLTCKAFLPGMIEQGSGHIINISSSGGRLLREDRRRGAAEDAGGLTDQMATFGEAKQNMPESTTAYGATKAALNRFSLGLAAEVEATGVAVNALEVGAVTDMVRMQLPEAYYRNVELPEAPAQCVAWVASQPGTFTGQVLVQSALLVQLRAEGIVRPKANQAEQVSD